MLDSDDGPGVGDDGEEADRQGEDEEGGVKHLVAQNLIPLKEEKTNDFEAQILRRGQTSSRNKILDPNAKKI